MKPMLFLAALVGLAACDTGVESRKEAVPPVESRSAALTAPAPAPLTAAGPASTVQPDAEVNLQWAASVVELTPLTRQGDVAVKLFGTAGGDPAMNGLYTHVAFFQGAAEGWRVFRIGDFLDYRVLSESAGRVDLEVEESVMDPRSGQIGSQKRRLIVAWTAGADGAPPASVTVTPAR